jgi:hypothetical protein
MNMRHFNAIRARPEVLLFEELFSPKLNDMTLLRLMIARRITKGGCIQPTSMKSQV